MLPAVRQWARGYLDYCITRLALEVGSLTGAGSGRRCFVDFVSCVIPRSAYLITPLHLCHPLILAAPSTHGQRVYLPASVCPVRWPRAVQARDHRSLASVSKPKDQHKLGLRPFPDKSDWPQILAHEPLANSAEYGRSLWPTFFTCLNSSRSQTRNRKCL